jgi:hypothetical protein
VKPYSSRDTDRVRYEESQKNGEQNLDRVAHATEIEDYQQNDDSDFDWKLLPPERPSEES